MPALNELKPAERAFFCDTLNHALSEENTDRLLGLIEARLETLEARLTESLPWYAKVARWIPGLPDPTEIVVKQLDKLLPELIRDPLTALVCEDAGEVDKAA